MKVWLWSAALLGGLGVYALSQMMSVPAANAATDLDAAIENFIKKNPKMIADTLDAYRQEVQLAEARAFALSGPTVGSPDAKVVFVEFGDYRCGYCRRVQDTLLDLREKYGDKVLFSYKPFPILSEESFNAALAVTAAQKQDKFWEFNTQLWDNQSRMGEELYVEIAKDLKLDMDKFNEDRNSDETKEYVVASAEVAQKNGGGGTPFFLINGNGVAGAQPLEAFVATIDEMLEEHGK